jgi:hypothetical protein
MRWSVLIGVLASCTSDPVDLPIAVVHVDANAASCGSACEPVYLEGMCGYNMPLIEPDTHSVTAYAGNDASTLAGLVQLQYTGSLTVPTEDGKPDHLDAIVSEGDRADIYALGQYDEDWLLYRITPLGEVTDIDTARLAAAEGSTLHFAYDGITEDHVIDAPRIVSVETDTTPCCAAGTPGGLALVFAAALVPLRRRRGGRHA